MQENTLRFFTAIEMKTELKNITSRAISAWVTMLLAAKRRRYNLYKQNRDNLIEQLDNYRLIKNQYDYTYGPDDLDVVNISLLKIDDLLDDFMIKTY